MSAYAPALLWVHALRRSWGLLWRPTSRYALSRNRSSRACAPRPCHSKWHKVVNGGQSRQSRSTVNASGRRMRHFECHYWWTLWDGFQTLPRRSNTRLTRENVTLPHPDGRPRRARSGPPTRPKRAIWKKRDSFQTLCSGGCLEVSLMNLRTSTRRGRRSMRSHGATACTGPRSSLNSIGKACPDAASPGK